jgi:hypothetical protein
MAGWLDELINSKSRKTHGRVLPSIFIKHTDSGVIFAIVGASSSYGKLRYHIMSMSDRSVTRIKESSLGSSYKFTNYEQYKQTGKKLH